jgi:hypothetical protein
VRVLLITAAIAACHAPGRPLPPTTTTVVDAAPLWLPGERLAWRIYWRALAIGHADLAVAPRTAHSRFRTNRLAALVGDASYALTSELAPFALIETVTFGGSTAHHERRDGDPAPGGGRLHSLHTALAAVRGWAHPGAPPGHLWLATSGGLYRLDVFSPVRDSVFAATALRVDGVIRGRDLPDAALTLWLSADPRRTPLRAAFAIAGERFSAELE